MLDRLIANDNAKLNLRRLVAAGRVPNALLFAGPEGVGKKEFALEIARTFVCGSLCENEGCAECSACRRAVTFDIPRPDNKDDFKKVFFSEHPDVGMVVAYKRNILVDAIRELEREANFRPYEGKARVFIIDDAERMNDAASNALLKTLEEPPASTYIVLITSRPDSLLPTIRSRCQVVRFAPASAAETREHLLMTGRVLPEDAELVARVSRGSIGKAMSFDVAAFRERREAMLGVIESAAFNGDIAGMLRAAEQMNDAKNKDGLEATLDVLELLVRDIWLLGNGSREVLNIDIDDRLAEIAKRTGPERAAAWLDRIEQMRQAFEVNINKKIATDALFTYMAA